ncbi:glutamate-5-semialdehyde dehydrogenase [Lachnoclostridium sp. Marseille-P6806]|uniref:glutamate-5-semialdehyde dehydrogenase n=1 Tax=Lachnoclostridium sp. Marseille-P6806 TaxID=2364793 RepID=UPI00102FA5DF|nr:glutamate-5-semialdehyde dehydrogenase [Lachnoclostridium sp. Marseille-P6806]
MTTRTSDIRQLCQRAKRASAEVQQLPAEKKNAVLLRAAELLCAESGKILEENRADLTRGRENNMPQGLLDRLALDRGRIEGIAEGLRQVAALEDPIGEVLEEYERPSGIRIRKVRVPLGVIGIIYESRPNVTADAFALCFKSGNTVILKGGSDALCSNRCLTGILREALAAEGVTEDAVNLIASTDRADTAEFLTMRGEVDVLIPRGSAGLIRFVTENSRIPVIETGAGNCHIYVDRDADIQKAIPIIVNAKTQRIGVCNAAESLVVHCGIMDRFLPLLSESMREHGVRLRADAPSAAFLPDSQPATEEDFRAEYLDYILSVKTAGSIEEAIAHINRCHTGHSDCIVTENPEAAERFLREVDSACVYHNASTRFTDGFEFGFGAEIGISTQKLHARGPMGLRELTSCKYLIRGDGTIRK